MTQHESDSISLKRMTGTESEFKNMLIFERIGQKSEVTYLT